MDENGNVLQTSGTDAGTSNAEQNQTASGNNAQYAGNTVDNNTSSDAASQAQYDDNNKSEEAQHRAEWWESLSTQEKAKYSKLEKDNAESTKKLEEAEKRAKEYERRLSILDSKLFKKDKSKYEEARKAFAEDGIELPDFETAYAIQQDQGATQQNTSVATTTTDPKAIARQVRDELEIDNQLSEFLKEDAIELAIQATDDESTIIAKKTKFDEINKLASVFIGMYPGRYKTYREAWKDAKSALPESREKAIREAQELGDLTNQAVANGQAATVGTVTTGQGGAKGDGQVLTAEELAFAAKLKITPEAYKKQKYG